MITSREQLQKLYDSPAERALLNDLLNAEEIAVPAAVVEDRKQ